MEVIKAMAEIGNPNSVSAGVAPCPHMVWERTNVKINAGNLATSPCCIGSPFR